MALEEELEELGIKGEAYTWFEVLQRQPTRLDVRILAVKPSAGRPGDRFMVTWEATLDIPSPTNVIGMAIVDLYDNNIKAWKRAGDTRFMWTKGERVKRGWVSCTVPELPPGRTKLRLTVTYGSLKATAIEVYEIITKELKTKLTTIGLASAIIGTITGVVYYLYKKKR